MPRYSTLIDEMDKEERNRLKQRLLKFQGNICFLCERDINLEADKTEIDHIIPIGDGGPDDEGNWALLHSDCNSKKRAKNLDLAKVLMKRDTLREKYGGALTTEQILNEFGGNEEEVYANESDNEILLRFSNKDKSFALHTDPSNPEYKFFFCLLPISVLAHDSELNPRKIINIDKLIGEFWRKNPQLHVALCRLHFEGKAGKGKILLFDGQHKTAAQILLGRTEIPARVFVNPPKDNLKEVNRRAHKELRQIEFFRSVLDSLGEDIFSVNFKKFLEDPNTSQKSEKGYIESIEAERRREEGKNLYHYLKARVRDCKNLFDENGIPINNVFFDYVEKDIARSKVWPISYDSVEKTFFRHFIDATPCEEPINVDSDKTYIRDIEARNLIKLMNLFANKVLKEKFDKTVGVYKLEDRIKKGDTTIPDDHLISYRLFRPAAFVVWCEFLKEAIANYLILNRKITNAMRKERKRGKGTRVFWVELEKEDWNAIEKIIDRLIRHKIWKDRGPVIANAFGQTRPEYFRNLLEKGEIEGVGKVLDEPIDIQYLQSGVGD